MEAHKLIPTYKSIHKVKDDNNKIKQYVIRNIHNSKDTITVESDLLKDKIKNKEVVIVNLQLTKDGRLIDSITDTLIQSYIESCNMLGLKPLTIEIRQDGHGNSEYIIVDIPTDTATISIPSFVTGISIHKRLNNIDKPVEIKSQLGLSNKEVSKYLREILNKVSIINDNTLEIYNETVESRKETTGLLNQLSEDNKEGIKTVIEELKSLEGVNSEKIDRLTNLIINDGVKIADTAKKMKPVINEMVEKAISNGNAYRLESSAITKLEPSKSDGSTLDAVKAAIQDKELYNSECDKYTYIKNDVSYEEAKELTYYCNYCYNMFIEMFNTLKTSKNIKFKDGNEFSDWVSTLTGASTYGAIFGASLADPTKLLGVAGLITIGASATKLVSDSIKGAVQFANGGMTLTQKIKGKKKSEELCEAFLKDSIDCVNDLEQYLDKFIFIFVLEYITSRSLNNNLKLNNKFVVNRQILETIHHLRGSRNDKLNTLEHQMLTAYMAATTYIKYNVKFKNDFTEQEIMEALLSRNIKNKENKVYNVSESDYKAVLKRQSIYNIIVIQYMRAAMRCMGVNTASINVFIDTYVQYLRADGMEPYNFIASNDKVNLRDNFDIKHEAYRIENTPDLY